MKDSELGEHAVKEGLASISKLGQDLIKEQRSARRWKTFGRLLLALIVLSIFVLPYFMKDKLGGLVKGVTPHAAVISLEGLVMAGAEIDADQIESALQSAFEAKQSKGIILQINSPGGSPVQAERIYNEITRLKVIYPEKKVIAVIEDIGASAAYFIASAADEIVASKASLVGSIGVVVNGFGAVDAMKKLGIERRLITAGDNKAMLDPFLPQDPAEAAYMQRIVDQIHVQFIEAVKQGRGDRLADRADIFSGLVWNGSEAKTLGLVDHIGSMGYALREILKIETQVDYTPVVDWMETFSKQVGASMGAAIDRIVTKQNMGLQ
ncbi:MAG: S49 family peptidase [Arenicellales bacterium]